VHATAARAALDELAEKWGHRYPAIIRLRENAWTEFIPRCSYPEPSAVWRRSRFDPRQGVGHRSGK
jgi:transposase-like protein